jgi:hypothetical protein
MAIALVATTKKASSGTSPSIDTTGANLIVFGVNTVSDFAVTFTDNKGNLYYRLVSSAVTTGFASIYWSFGDSLVSVGSGHTFTVTGNFPSFEVAAFSGVSTTFALDKNFKRNNLTGTSVQAGSLTPSVADCLILAAMAYRDTTTVSIDSGFTITDQNPFSGGVACGGALAYLIQSGGPSAVNPTWSWTNSAVAAAVALNLRSPAASVGSSGFGFSG